MSLVHDRDFALSSDSTPTKLSTIVGKNLRHFRSRRGLSLDKLARISSVSRAMLNQIENGKSAPTINLLGRIAEALKVSVPSLISSPGAGGTVIVPRNRAAGSTSSESGLGCRARFPWSDPQKIAIFEVTIAAGQCETLPVHETGSRTTLVVTSGHVEITVAEASPATLLEGDAILFDADTRHSLRNPASFDAKALVVFNGVTRPPS